MPPDPSLLPLSPGGSPPVPTSPGSGASRFLRSIEDALENLVTLKVVTIVGDVTVTSQDGTFAVAPRDPNGVKAASTAINLLDGHILNVLSPDFASAGGDGLQDFHKSQVERSNALVISNLAELQKLATALLSRR